MFPIKHLKNPLGKGLEAHPTAFQCNVKINSAISCEISLRKIMSMFGDDDDLFH